MSSVEPHDGLGAAGALGGVTAATPPPAHSNGGTGSATHAPAGASTPAAVTLPPPGYALVTLLLEGREQPALLNLPIEVGRHRR